MRNLKSVVGVVVTLGLILYCGRLVYYFVDLSGSYNEAWDLGLGPTVLGLSIIGLIFFVVLGVKLVLIFARPRSSGPNGRSDPDAPVSGGDSGLDADAVIARYMAQRSAQAASESPVASGARPATEGSAPPTRPTFGRKVR